MRCFRRILPISFFLFQPVFSLSGSCQEAATAPADWVISTPITTYWGGPGYPGGVPLDDAAAERLAGAGWNLVWCHENELDTAHRHGLRAHLYHPVLTRLDTLDNPAAKAELDALIGRVKDHPALYSYHLTDEPDAGKFSRLGRIVAYLREKDPGTMAYINLLPTYANNKQLGTEGDKITAYKEHLDRYVAEVKPALISYDHYQFTRSGDAGDYFLNLELIREKSLQAGLPFLNIVQSSSWVPGEAASPHSPRVPGPDELRFLVNTSLAYGAQGISYYIYSHKTHEGGMVDRAGNLTPLHHEAAVSNPAFVMIARELQPLTSLGAFHAGMKVNGAKMLKEEMPFQLVPPVPETEPVPGAPARGIVIGHFGKKGTALAEASHAMVVNLDYKADANLTVTAPAHLEIFDETSGKWSGTASNQVTLKLAKGGGKLIRRKQ